MDSPAFRNADAGTFDPDQIGELILAVKNASSDYLKGLVNDPALLEPMLRVLLHYLAGRDFKTQRG